MSLPQIDLTQRAVLQALNELMFTMWHNPENPELNMLYNDMVEADGYTAFDPYPLGMNVLTAPVAAPFANPRAILPVIDGMGVNVSFVNHFELKVPITGETVDEYEARMLQSKIFGMDINKVPAIDRFQARFNYAQTAILNRLAVSAMNLIEASSIVAVDTGNGVNVTNTFPRTEVTAVANLYTDQAPYADLTAGGLTGERWVANDGTTNTGASPFKGVQAQIATLKRYGGGSVKYFVMSPKALQAYKDDFTANYAELFKATNILVAAAPFSLPIQAQKAGWHVIGYVHDESENYRLIPVLAGSNVKYLNWMNRSSLQNFLPTSEFSFPVGSVPTIGTRHTWIKIDRLKEQKEVVGVNLWREEESGALQGAVLSRQTMYPKLHPNALVFWVVG